MAKIGTPVRITEEGLLVIRSIQSYEECRKYRKSYEWSITLYLYATDKEQSQNFFGLSNSEYFRWLKLLAQKSSQNRNKARNEKKDNKKQFYTV